MTAEKKIAIIGKSSGSLHLAPYADPEWEIWTLNNLVVCGQAPRFTRHFEIHPIDDCLKEEGGVEYVRWLAAVRDQPVYLMRALDKRVPAGVLYPSDAIVAYFGTYFNNTVSWMIALAIHEGATTIGMYGVDMAVGAEYGHQRPSCEFFLGWARGAGIDIIVPSECDLLKVHVIYGLEDEGTGDLRKRLVGHLQDVGGRQRKYETAAQEANNNAIYLKGVMAADQRTLQFVYGDRTSKEV